MTGPAEPGLALDCLCGVVRVTIAERPGFIHACNCTLCRRSGALWAYFDPAQVTVRGATRGHRRADKAEASAQRHFCPTCGVTTHFALTEQAIARPGNSMAGVNMALADASALAGIELRFPDGRGRNGDGPFGYMRESEIIGG